jgi:site-specific DNA recombinase
MSGPRGRAGIYARVSTEDQAEKGYSMESQIEACRQRAAELGYRSGETVLYTDDVSGTIADRPGLNALREWCGSGEPPDVVIVYDPDRLARKLSLQLMFTDEWLKKGIRLEFVSFEWNNTPEGRMFYQLRGMFAEFEREKIRERTIRGKMTKLKNTGKLSGDPRLYGYRFDTERDVLLVEPQSSEVVKRIFRLAADGQSGEEIARRLASLGIPAPRGNRWHGSTITRILHNRSYLGEYKAYKTDYHQGYKRKRPESEQFPLSIEPLVDEELFLEAQRTLLRMRTRTGRPPKREVLLSGMARCFCGRAMSVGGTSSGRTHAYYICSSRLKKAYPSVPSSSGDPELFSVEPLLDVRCGNGYWNTAVVDQAVWQELARYLLCSRSKWVTRLTARDAEGVPPDDVYAAARLEDAETKLRKLLELYLSDGISRELYDEKRTALEQEAFQWRKRLEADFVRRRECRGSDPDALSRSEQIFADDSRSETALLKLPFPLRRKVVQLLLEQAVFQEGFQVQLMFRLPQKPCDGQSHGGL